jgi:hypothetical protein
MKPMGLEEDKLIGRKIVLKSADGKQLFPYIVVEKLDTAKKIEAFKGAFSSCFRMDAGINDFGRRLAGASPENLLYYCQPDPGQIGFSKKQPLGCLLSAEEIKAVAV